ncbi:phage/plasmid primase, P4 family [Rhodoferax sp.]|uniref:DNA primase family protein n=1 Tax=Rhodoferax sp. TaxID=50421 RepID=UPI00283FB63E|nr:phage/plasmid primase, P4 family [Rhodoferax sp.]MDR3371204.1 phage/plasmid primase, P4 family [Rhodoferax sp.]
MMNDTSFTNIPKHGNGATAITATAMTALEFFHTILPVEGNYYACVVRTGRPGVAHIACDSLEALAEAVDAFNKKPGVQVYHACAAYKKAFVVDGDKRKYRTSENLLSAKAFWIDLDCGPAKAAEGKGYVTKRDAAIAISNFCKLTSFPVPVLVSSGNGLHAYWPLTEAIPPDVWKVQAVTLKAVLKKFGVRADPSRTADMASILRPVGSHNKKNPDALKEVKAIGNKAVSHTPSEFIAILSNIVANYDVCIEHVTAYTDGMNSDLTGHMTARAYPDAPIDANLIADRCQQIARVRENGGDGYDTWRGVIGIVKHCEGGEAIAHVWSGKSPQYSNAETQQKLDTWNAGPTTCQFFGQHNPTGCDGCTHKGKITSPIQLGRVAVAAASALNAPSGKLQDLNDAGNADRIVRAAAGRLRWCKDLAGWLVWDDMHWRWDGRGGVVQYATGVMRGIYDEAKQESHTGDAKRLAQHASNSLSLSRIAAAIELMKSCAGIPVAASELDANPFLIGVLNGVVDLRSGEFRPATADDLITRRMNVEYVAGATCPVWEATINTVLNENPEVVAFFQRSAGYSITGSTSEQCLFFLYGSGANGKSTVLNVLREIAGSYGIQTSPEVLMAKSNINASGPTPEIARLAGPRFVAANETEEGQRLAEAMVKQLTGGDAMTARVLHGAPFDFVPLFKLWLAGNHRPVIRGNDYGIWRRLVMIGFDHKFLPSEQNKHLPELLCNERPGILNWLIAGCIEWQRRGLDRPTEIVRQIEAYKSDMDLVQHWIDDECTIGADLQIRAGEAYASYKNWSFNNGHRQISNQTFSQKLKDRGCSKGANNQGAYYRGMAKR